VQMTCRFLPRVARFPRLFTLSGEPHVCGCWYCDCGV